MATPAEIKLIVIDGLNKICRPRWNPETDTKRYLESVEVYCRVLGAYDVASLKAGMVDWEMAWTKMAWPLPAELVPFMNQASLEPTPEATIEDHSHEDRERTPDEIAAYRAETTRMVAALDKKLAFLGRVGTKPAKPENFTKVSAHNVPMPAHLRSKIITPADKGEG